MTYNVRSLRDDVDALAAVVRACAPDVLLVPGGAAVRPLAFEAAALARRCGLVVATADRPAGCASSTALRVDVLGTSFALLPKTVGHHQRAVVGATVGLRRRAMAGADRSHEHRCRGAACPSERGTVGVAGDRAARH